MSKECMSCPPQLAPAEDAIVDEAPSLALSTAKAACSAETGLCAGASAALGVSSSASSDGRRRRRRHARRRLGVGEATARSDDESDDESDKDNDNDDDDGDVVVTRARTVVRAETVPEVRS